MIDLTRKPTRQDLRWFGVIMMVFFSALAAVAGLKLGARGTAVGLSCAGLVLALLFYAVKPLRVPLYLAWMRVFYPMAWIISHAIVAVIYYLVVTPIGLIMRLFGHDPMRRRFERGAQTYWVASRRNESLTQYFRQY